MNNEKNCLVKILEPLSKKGTLNIRENYWALNLKKQFNQIAYIEFIKDQARQHFPFSEVFIKDEEIIIIELYWNV